MRLGVMAGGGKLPFYVATAARERGELATIIAFEGFAERALFPNAERFGLAQFGKTVKHLKKLGVTHICFAGIITRPDFSALKPDLKAMRHLPGVMRAAGQGDDALMRHVLGLYESEGFIVVAPQDVSDSLLLGEGPLGRINLSSEHRNDVLKAFEVASEIGRLDIGQGAVVAKGVVLAVEAQEGTDAMLTRITALRPELRGTADARVGVLAKVLKPTQDTRVDMPTLGVETVRLAAEAGLAGIAATAGEAFVIDRDAVIAKADEVGIFVIGIPAATPAS